MTRILGLDISSASSGWAVLDDGYLIDQKNCGVIKMKGFHGERLVIFEERLGKLIEEYRPDFVSIEDLFLSFRNPKVSVILGYYHGMAKKVIWQYLKVEPIVHTATSFRKVLGEKFGINLLPGKKEKLETGKDSKMMTFELIQRHFGLTDWTFKKHNDTTDALAACLATYLILNVGARHGDALDKKEKKEDKEREGASHKKNKRVAD